MATGSFSPYYPEQDNAGKHLASEDSYFLIRLHDSQVLFSANLLQQAGMLSIRSSVTCSSAPTSSMERLYKFASLKKNIPHLPGIHINLTPWLPCSDSDSVKVTFDCEVLHGTPIKSLVDKTNDLQLVPVVSLVQPVVGTALTIGQIVGGLLSFFVKEGSKTPVFSFDMVWNLKDLLVGYYAMVGSQTDKAEPRKLKMENGQLRFSDNGHPLSDYSYAVLEVLTLPRLPGAVSSTTWGELLYYCRDIALNTRIKDEDDRIEAFERWHTSLENVRFLARNDKSVLKREVSEVIGKAALEVEQKLRSPIIHQNNSREEYPERWQQVVGFATPQELRQAVRDYQDAVALSEQLLREYQQKDNAL